MRLKLASGLAATCAVVFNLPAWSHHSHGNYVDAFMDIEGIVKEVHLIVPHSWVYVEVKDAGGEPKSWALVSTGCAGCRYAGGAYNTVQHGHDATGRFI